MPSFPQRTVPHRESVGKVGGGIAGMLRPPSSVDFWRDSTHVSPAITRNLKEERVGRGAKKERRDVRADEGLEEEGSDDDAIGTGHASGWLAPATSFLMQHCLPFCLIKLQFQNQEHSVSCRDWMGKLTAE